MKVKVLLGEADLRSDCERRAEAEKGSKTRSGFVVKK